VPPDPLMREGAPLSFRREIFVPMRHQAASVAVLVLFDRHEEPPSPGMAAVVQGVADVAAAVLEHARLLEAARGLALQLQEALSSRVVLEQAKGMLAERSGSDPDAAFRALREVARRERRAIGAVAADVVERRVGAVG
jgi:GAF domain-containing protein